MPRNGASRTLPSQYEKFDDPNNSSWRDYFLKLDAHVQDVAKLGVNQTFTGFNTWANASIASGGILLNPTGYSTLLALNKASNNSALANAGGGNSAYYIQHLVDSSSAANNNVNTGIRVQLQTSQTSTAAVNDAVAGYFGLYTLGVNIGGFGIHVDAYHASTGASSSMYGVSSEMFRQSSAGFTVGMHTRSIDGAGFLDNDYGFLASPSVGGTKKFKTVFSAGSAVTGTLQSDTGLDLAYTTCSLGIAIRIPPDRVIVMDGTANQVTLGYNAAVGGRLDYGVAGVGLLWGVENTGRQYYINNANTVVGTAWVASGNSHVVNVGGTLYKIQLGVFP